MQFIDTNFLFSAHGFGINTNLFETNVINLAAVIAIVLSVVGDVIKELLEDRKNTILTNLRAADDRAQEIEDNLNKARKQLETAQRKAVDIKNGSVVEAEKEQAMCIAKAELEAKTLKQRKEDSIRLQQQKAIKEISRQIISLSLKQARENASKKTSSARFQRWVNRARFVHYRTVDKYLKNLV